MAEQETTQETPSEVVGRFATPEAARAALVRIEGLGIDADRITLHVDGTSVPTKEGLNEADRDATSEVATTAGLAAGLGAIAGAAAGVVGGIVTGDVATGATIGAAAVVGGGVVGGLAGTYVSLPVNEDAWTTYELDPSDDHDLTITVRVHDREEAVRIRDAMRATEGGGPDPES
jgi:uncharacterized protein YcfJ